MSESENETITSVVEMNERTTKRVLTNQLRFVVKRIGIMDMGAPNGVRTIEKHILQQATELRDSVTGKYNGIEWNDVPIIAGDTF